MENRTDSARRLMRPMGGKPRYYLAVGDDCLCRVPVETVGGGGVGARMQLKRGRVVYIHPERRFITAEFEGQPGAFGACKPGRYRRSVWPEMCQRYNKKGAEILNQKGARG